MSVLRGSDTLKQAYPKINSKFDALDAKDRELQSNIDTSNRNNAAEIERIDNRIDNIVSQAGDDNTEIVDARLGADGKARPTLGTLVREIHEEVVEPKYTDPIVIEGGIGSIPDNAAEGQVSVGLKGNTFTQIVKNGNFADGVNGWRGANSDISVKNGIMTSVGNGTHPNPRIEQVLQNSRNLTPGTKVFLKATVTVKNPSCKAIAIRAFTSGEIKFVTFARETSIANGKTYILYGIGTVPDGVDSLSVIQIVHEYSNAEESDGNSIEIKDVMMFNLTQEGLEHLSADEINKMTPNYLQTGTKSTVGAMRVKSVGKNLFDKNKTFTDRFLSAEGEWIIYPNRFTTHKIACKPNTSYRIIGGNRTTCRYEDNNGNLVGVTTTRTTVAPADARFMYVYYGFDIDLRDELMIIEGTNDIPYEPYRESNAYVVAADKDTGEILELRSLPNGTKDEVRDGKLIKRVSNNIDFKKLFNFTDISDLGTTLRFTATNIDRALPNLKHDTSYGQYVFLRNLNIPYIPNFSMDEEHYYIGAGGTTFFIFINKTKLTAQTHQALFEFLEQNQVSLTYQLAQEKIIELQPQSLTIYPNGTVYWEPIVKETAVYNNGISIDNGIPIKAIEKLYMTDGQTKTEIPIQNINIAPDGLSFTIVGATDGETYEYIYEYDSSLTTIPTMEIIANKNLKAIVRSTDKALTTLNSAVLDLNDFTVAMLLNHEMRLTLLEV